jgi:hypothetical protein
MYSLAGGGQDGLRIDRMARIAAMMRSSGPKCGQSRRAAFVLARVLN